MVSDALNTLNDNISGLTASLARLRTVTDPAAIACTFVDDDSDPVNLADLIRVIDHAETLLDELSRKAVRMDGKGAGR